jgi:hypothetical protein
MRDSGRGAPPDRTGWAWIIVAVMLGVLLLALLLSAT